MTGAVNRPASDRTLARWQRLVVRYGAALALSLLALVTLLLLVHPVSRLPLRIPIDYNEGWNAFHAVRALGPERLYPPMTALITNNYPPLSFYLIGGLGSLLGDQIIAGRLVSLLSLLIVALNIGIVVRTMGGTRPTAAFAGLFFIGYMAGYNPWFVAMNDPQLLAHALMTTAFAIFLRKWRQRPWLMATAALMLASGLIKHNLIPLPLAITVWLFLYDRGAFALWLGTSIVLLVACSFAADLAYGPAFFSALLASPREYESAALTSKMAEWLPSMLPLLGLTLVLGHLDRGNPNTRLILIYILISGLWGGFIAGGAGVDRNALFDLLIGLTIASAVTIDRLGRGTADASRYGALLRTAGPLMLVAIVLAPAPGRLLKARTFLAELADREAQAETDLAFLAGHPGSVACEVLALCYWAGKGFEIDFYGTGQKLRTGMIPRSALAKRLEHHEFDVIQLQNKRHFRLTKEIHAVLLRHYSVERFSDINGFFFVPRVDQPDVAPSIR